MMKSLCARLAAVLPAALLVLAGLPAGAQEKKTPKKTEKPAVADQEKPVAPHRQPGELQPRAAAPADVPAGTHQMTIYNGDIATMHYFAQDGADGQAREALARREAEQNESAQVRLVSRQLDSSRLQDAVGSELAAGTLPRLGIAANSPAFPFPYFGHGYHGLGLGAYATPGVAFGSPYFGGYPAASLAALHFVNPRAAGTLTAYNAPRVLNVPVGLNGPGGVVGVANEGAPFKAGEPVSIMKKGEKEPITGSIQSASPNYIIIRVGQ